MNKLFLDRAVIGGNLETLIYSFVNGIPLILVNPVIPSVTDYHSSGLSKKTLWERLSFILSYAGLNPCEQKLSSHRIDGTTVKVFGKTPYSYEFECGDITILRADEADIQYRVVDHFKITRLAYKFCNLFSKLETGDSFINTINIYPQRNNMRGSAISFIKSSDIRSEDYSETYARLKIEKLLKSNGMIGKYMGTIREPKFVPIKLDMIQREIHSINTLEDEIISQKALPKHPGLLKCVEIFGNPYEP